jgi:Domain of unknown function (DUF6916)
MSAPLTEEEFSQHVNTKFRLNVDTAEPLELELVEVKTYVNKDKPGERGGMERFSAFFRGPLDAFLRQATYSLSHEKMGSFEIFLVPLARDEKGYSYEAVFNYMK